MSIMRKSVILSMLAALLMVAVPANAKFSWGIEGGMSFNKMKLSKKMVMDSENRTGWFIGPKAQFKIPILGLGVDAAILYAHKSMELTSTNEDNAVVSTTKSMPCIDIPVNARWNFGMSSIIGAYIATGPQWSWNTGGTHISLNNLSGTLEKSNFSWNVGCGINAFKHLQLGVTYNIAMGKTGEFEVKDVVNNVVNLKSMRNNSWQIRLAYMF